MRSFAVLLLATVAAAACALVTAKPTESSNEPRIWALLVAGSNGYYNYRHQADVCHAYHVLHRHGIPDEQIVVMMYDDIANAAENPTKGVLINHPNGPNVYEGVLKDYTGNNVTAKNFLNILKGDKDAMKGIGSGKVIDSNENDHIFVFFSDHGAPGLVCFPNEDLKAHALVNTLKEMHKEKRFARLVFYLEACESGSMFDGLLPKDINVFATTAASDDESSYACYYDDARQTYLGDVYSVKWMEDSDVEDLTTETLQKQFNIVKEETNTSSVHEFGDVAFAKETTLSEFQGYRKAEPQRLPRVNLDAVDSREVPVAILQKKIQSASDKATLAQLQAELEELLEKRAFVDRKVNEIADALGQTTEMRQETTLDLDHDCYGQIVDRFNEVCFNLAHNTYVLKHMRMFANMCDASKNNLKVEDVLTVLESVCTHPKVDGII